MQAPREQRERAMREELLFGPVAVDANALDRDGTERDALVDRFWKGAEAGAFTLLVPGGVRAELLHPETPGALRDLALSRPAPLRAAPTHEQKLDRIRVRAILRGDAPSGKHEADALHLSEAAEAGCAFFITHDRRILRRRADLRGVLPDLSIVTLEKFLAQVEAGGEAPEEDGCGGFDLTA
jgi:hypothetical protein